MKKIFVLPVAYLLTAATAIGTAGADASTITFSTLAGTADSVINSAEGTGSAARFYSPRGAAVDSAGNLFVADSSNHTLRKVSAAAVVGTLAGTAGSQGNSDGSGATARFLDPYGAAVDSSGNIYVADTSNNKIRKITSAGLVTTLAGNGAQGSADGIGTAAQFREPRGVAVDSNGYVYVADYGNHTLRKISPAGVVTTLAGTAGSAGVIDATGSAARFYYPSGVAVDVAGNLYVADTSNNTLRKIAPAGAVTTFAGLAGRSSSADGTGSAARFEDPYAVASDGGGNIFVADGTDHTIRKISASGVVTTLAGTAGSFGSTDGAGSAARFFGPLGIAADSAGSVYVADTGNYTIRKITAAGSVGTFAGSAGVAGTADGTGAAARFSAPYGVAVDLAGNVFVVDQDVIRNDYAGRGSHDLRRFAGGERVRRWNGICRTLFDTFRFDGRYGRQRLCLRSWQPCGAENKPGWAGHHAGRQWHRW